MVFMLMQFKVKKKKLKMLELFLRAAKKVAKEKRAKHAIREI